MKGPIDESINSGKKRDDKARKRLEEFIEQRYPGGLPPESSPLEERTSDQRVKPAKPRKYKSKRSKSKTG
jgi:hypothetical protein